MTNEVSLKFFTYFIKKTVYVIIFFTPKIYESYKMYVNYPKEETYTTESAAS